MLNLYLVLNKIKNKIVIFINAIYFILIEIYLELRHLHSLFNIIFLIFLGFFTFFIETKTCYAQQQKQTKLQYILNKSEQTQKQLLKKKEKINSNLESIQKEKQHAILKAQQDQKRAHQIKNNMVVETEKLQTTETKIENLNQRITALKSKIVQLNNQLQIESKKFSKFLPLIERLSLYPSDTLLVAPHKSIRATLGLSIIQTLSKELEKQAKQIKQHQQEIVQLQHQFNDQITELTQLRKKQLDEQSKLTTALKQARIAQQESAKAVFEISQNAANAAQKAKNINDAIKQINLTKIRAQQQLKAEILRAKKAHNLAQLKKAQKESKIIASANNGPGLNAKMTSKTNAPVIGPIVSLWGSKTETGPAQGITYAPQSQATVRSPCNGLVEFSGPFRGYGHMIILNCGKNYRFVLAGMNSLSVAIGQTINKGIMVGQMPLWSGGITGRPTLFVQLRRGERAINPSPFL